MDQRIFARVLVKKKLIEEQENFTILSRISDRAVYLADDCKGDNDTQQLTLNSMLLKRVRHRVERPLLVQTLPVDRYNQQTERKS